MQETSQPQVALAVSAVTASASAASWAVDHAAWFTIAAALAAILSGFAAFVFYIVSIYYKIRYEHSPGPEMKVVSKEVIVKESK